MITLETLLWFGPISAILSWIGVRIIRSYAITRQMISSETTQITPRGAGLAILVVVILIFMPVGFSFSDPGLVTRFALAAVFLGMIGFVDDLRKLPRLIRLGLQAATAMIFVPAAPIRQIGLPGLVINFPDWAAYTVSVIWIVALCNAYNYMDGIDGLGGGQAVIGGLVWVGVGLVMLDPLILLLGLLIAGASAGFLVYNVPPASIFMGDVGTTFIGFSLAALPMLAAARGNAPRLLVAGGLLAGLFLFDAVLTFLRYLPRTTGRSRRYRSHLYQRLVATGVAPQLVTALYLSISLCFGAASLIYWQHSSWAALILTGLACLILFTVITLRERMQRINSANEPH